MVLTTFSELGLCGAGEPHVFLVKVQRGDVCVVISGYRECVDFRMGIYAICVVLQPEFEHKLHIMNRKTLSLMLPKTQGNQRDASLQSP